MPSQAKPKAAAEKHKKISPKDKNNVGFSKNASKKKIAKKGVYARSYIVLSHSVLDILCE